MMSEHEPCFTEDWTSHNYPVWVQLFESRVGQPLQLLEIGSHEGRSTLWWLEHLLTHFDSRITCVDPWTPWRRPTPEEFFDRNVATASHRVLKRKGFSQQVLPKLLLEGLCYDVIYIDGDHNAAAVLADAVLSWPLLRVGGIMLFDDYTWVGDQVDLLPKRGVDAFLDCYGPYLHVLHKAHQVAVRRIGGSATEPG